MARTRHPVFHEDQRGELDVVDDVLAEQDPGERRFSPLLGLLSNRA